MTNLLILWKATRRYGLLGAIGALAWFNRQRILNFAERKGYLRPLRAKGRKAA